MNTIERFNHYLEHLTEGLGHSDRHAGLRGYCTGLMLHLSRQAQNYSYDTVRLSGNFPT